MSSFLPEGGRYELLSVIGKVQGLLFYLQAPGHGLASSASPDQHVPEAVSWLAGPRVIKLAFVALLCFCLPNLGKEIMLLEVLLQFFLSGL